MASVPYTLTELNASVDEVWDRKAEDARYSKGVVLNRVANRSALVKSSGDKINVTVKKRYSVSSIASDGTFSTQTTTPDSVQITVDQNEGIPIEVTDIARAQSFWDPDSDIPSDAGAAFAERYDNVLLALQSSLTGLTAVGDVESPTPFGLTAIRTAMLRLANARIPMTDLSFIIPPVGFWSGIATESQYMDAHKTGLPKSVLTSGFRTALFGVPFYESPEVATTGSSSQTRTGVLIHKSAWGIAFQRNNQIRRGDRITSLVDSYVTLIKSLYGVKVIRSDHGVRIHIAA